jgi:hypothetical protein
VEPDTTQQGAAPEGATATVEVQGGELRSGRVQIPMDPDAKAAADKAAAEAKEAAKNRPSWLPEKFKTPEDLAKSYTELEKAFHAKTAPPPATDKPKPDTPPAEDKPKLDTPKADLAAVAAEFEQTGSLSEDTYTKLAAAGFDRATVDSHIAGQVALAKQIRQDIASVAGGEEKLTKVLEWAGKNLPKDQIEAYDAAAKSKNVNLVKLALAGIVQAFNTANPAEPNLITGQPAPLSGGVQPFRSNAEIVEAMRDRRYQTDPAYRELVARRMAAGSI